MRGLWTVGLALAAVLWGGAASASEDLGTLKVGVLKFGTVNWELDVIKHHGLDQERGFDLQVEGFGNKQATNVALQGKAADAIVTDWLWVSRQRAEGQPFTFIPYSNTVGALMVPPDSDIASLEDLAGKKIGVAGGPLDKSWLLLQALAKERHGIELAEVVEPAFGAPPLLNEKVQDGELDGVLTFWHFAARLEAKGFKRLVGIEEAMAELGVEHRVPQLGYVFDDSLGQAKPELVLAFADASRAAKELLRTDAEWERIRPLTKAKDDATFETLKLRFREGIPEHWGEAERADAAKLYAILAELGGEKLVGKASELSPGTFWADVSF